MDKHYKEILSRIEVEEPFTIDEKDENYRYAVELSKSGLIVFVPSASVGYVDGITVQGRDYLHRVRIYVGRLVISLVLSLCSGLLGVVLGFQYASNRSKPHVMRNCGVACEPSPELPVPVEVPPVEEPVPDLGKAEVKPMLEGGEQGGGASKGEEGEPEHGDGDNRSEEVASQQGGKNGDESEEARD